MLKQNKIYNYIHQALEDTFFIWRKELGRLLHDQGVLIFFILVPLLYPLLYAFIYTNETVREVPVVVVDQSFSALSRDFVRRTDASPDVRIIGYCNNMEEAKKAMRRQEAYGMVYIPADFSKTLNKGEQTTVSLFCDMSGLLYYKALLATCTDVSLNMNQEIQIKRMGNTTTRQDEISTVPLAYEYVTMFNPTNGFASFLLPGVLILIIQQTLLLGIGLINGSARERNTFHTQIIPGHTNGVLRLVIGKSLCYFMLYALMSVWLLIAVPKLFGLVQIPQPAVLLAFLLPYVLSCIFFAMTLSVIVHSRETCMPLFVFTSLPLLFISGISWPGAAISDFWKGVSWIFPSSFGINGFVRINSMGALLHDVAFEYKALWIQVVVYFLTSCCVYGYLIRRSERLSKEDKQQ